MPNAEVDEAEITRWSGFRWRTQTRQLKCVKVGESKLSPQQLKWFKTETTTYVKM